MVAKQDQFCRVLLGARAKAEKRVAQEPFVLPYTANKTTVQILAERSCSVGMNNQSNTKLR